MEGLNKRGQPYRVLIIDDLPLTAKQLGKILTTEGFDVVDTAVNGYQGVMMYKALHPTVDLVTLDITKPGLDGVSALEMILEFNKQAKVIMISGNDNKDMIIKCLQKGAKSYIVKPLDRDKVLKRVVPVVGGVEKGIIL
jgi:two-component system chemotaxis response regulator CheY